MTEVITMTGFTKAQMRALAWLPLTGAWRSPTREISSACGSLRLYHPGLVLVRRSVLDDFAAYYRLTEAGVAAARTLAAQVTP